MDGFRWGNARKQWDSIGQHDWCAETTTLDLIVVKFFVGIMAKESFKEGFEGE